MNYLLNSQIEKVLIPLMLFFVIISCKKQTSQQSSSQNIVEDVVLAPNFTLTSTDGEKISLADYKGKTLVIHIATTWCPYCNAEAPHLEELGKEYKSKGVEVIIIDVKESKELVEEKIVNQFNLSFPVLLDIDGRVAASFAPDDVLPELARDEIMLASNIIVDKNGKIRFMSLLDTKNFDSKLIHVKKTLDEIL